MSDKAIQDISKLENLLEVDLRDTKITAEGLAKLKKNLPQCYFEKWRSWIAEGEAIDRVLVRTDDELGKVLAGYLRKWSRSESGTL